MSSRSTTPTMTVTISSATTASTSPAPSTTRASVVASARKLPNTRAVTPTLVAASTAPMRTDAVPDCPSHTEARDPPANDRATPTMATATAVLPTLARSPRFISMPACTRNTSTPIVPITATNPPDNSSAPRMSITDGPMRTPRITGPTTAGMPARSEISAPILPAARMISRSSSSLPRSTVSMDAAITAGR